MAVIEKNKIVHSGAKMEVYVLLSRNAFELANSHQTAFKQAKNLPIDIDQVTSNGSKIFVFVSAVVCLQSLQQLGNHLQTAPTSAMMRSP